MFSEQVGRGSWVLGDLADTFRRLSDVLGDAASQLGRSSEVVMVMVAPPESSSELPMVAVVVENELAVQRLRSQLMSSGYDVRWVGGQAANGWSAELSGFRLTVASEALA